MNQWDDVYAIHFESNTHCMVPNMWKSPTKPWFPGDVFTWRDCIVKLRLVYHCSLMFFICKPQMGSSIPADRLNFDGYILAYIRFTNHFVRGTCYASGICPKYGLNMNKSQKIVINSMRRFHRTKAVLFATICNPGNLMMIPIDFHYWPVDEPFLPGLVVDIPEWTFEKKVIAMASYPQKRHLSLELWNTYLYIYI